MVVSYKAHYFHFAGILSIHPNVFLLKNKNTTQKIIKIPKSVLLLVRFELVLLGVIPLLAVLIANGYVSI